MHSILIECVLFQIIAFDELRTDFKSPIDQCNPVHAVSSGACGGQGESPQVTGLTNDSGGFKEQNKEGYVVLVLPLFLADSCYRASLLRSAELLQSIHCQSSVTVPVTPGVGVEGSASDFWVLISDHRQKRCVGQHVCRVCKYHVTMYGPLALWEVGSG